MAGLSSLMMRPRPLGVGVLLRGLGHDHTPGVYSCGVVGGGGGGGGGSGSTWSGGARYGMNGSSGRTSITILFSRIGFTVTQGGAGNGGSYGEVQGSSGQAGSLSRIQPVGLSAVLQAGGGSGGGTGSTSDRGSGYENSSPRLNENSYNGRGWLMQTIRLAGVFYGAGGKPGGVTGGPSGGSGGSYGSASIGARIG